MQNEHTFGEQMNKIPETKEEWDLLPKEVRERLGQFAFSDTVQQITHFISENMGEDGEIDLEEIVESPERSRRLFRRGWLYKKVQKRYYKHLRRKYERNA